MLVGKRDRGFESRFLHRGVSAAGTCIKQAELERLWRKLDLAFEDMGKQTLKNIARPLCVYRVRPDRAAGAASEGLVICGDR